MPSATRAPYSGDLARRARQQVLAPQHVGDPHQRVVDRVDQRVERVTVGAAQREVGDVLGLERDVSADQVVPGDRAVGHPEPHDRPATFGLECRPLLGGELAAEAVVPHHLRAGRLAARVDLVVVAEALIGVRRVAQPGQRVGVDLAALALLVGAVRATDLDPLVPGEAEPAPQVQDRVVGLLGVALLVGVLHPEDDGAAEVAREGPVEQRRADQADVRGAGRGRAEADADGYVGRACRDHQRCATLFVRVPRPAIEISTSSPTSMGPTPSGVPVRMTSPGSSVITLET